MLNALLNQVYGTYEECKKFFVGRAHKAEEYFLNKLCPTALCGFFGPVMFVDFSSIFLLIFVASATRAMHSLTPTIEATIRAQRAIPEGFKPAPLLRHSLIKNGKVIAMSLTSLATFMLIQSLKPSPESFDLLQFCADPVGIFETLMSASLLMGYIHSKKIAKLLNYQFHADEGGLVAPSEEFLLLREKIRMTGLVSIDLDINGKDEYGIPLLISAVAARDYKTAQSLLMRRVNVKAVCPHSGKSAFWYAAKNVAHDESSLQVSENAKKFYKDGLHFIRLLSKLGINNIELNESLYKAVKCNAINFAKFLLELGADGSVNVKGQIAINASLLQNDEWFTMLSEHYQEHADNLKVPSLKALVANALYQKNGSTLFENHHPQVPEELFFYYAQTINREKLREIRQNSFQHYKEVITDAQTQKNSL